MKNRPAADLKGWPFFYSPTHPPKERKEGARVETQRDGEVNGIGRFFITTAVGFAK